jgi:uncharacterized protein
MNVRTVTVGVPLDRLEETEPQIRDTLTRLRGELGQHEIAIRTTRLTTTPLVPDSDDRVNAARIHGQLKQASDLGERLELRWFNVPFDLTAASPAALPALTSLAFEITRRHTRAFVNLIAAANGVLSFPAMLAASRFIKQVAQLDTSGYHNFRVGVACNVKPHTPFFPFAYSSEVPGFSMGLEMPQELIRIVAASPNASLGQLRDQFLEAILPQVKRIDEIASAVSQKTGLAFHGIDLSIAPFPEPQGSVAQLMEMLGLEQYGGHGTQFLTAYLTDIIKEVARRGQIHTVGFNGVMLSLLEDEFMGRRNNYNTYSIDSLILYSTMCGCGVDMVPIPGDTFEEEIASLILDVATTSTMLDKPLGVRLLPIPSKHEHEFTAFNMDFLFNTRIKKIRNLGLARQRLDDAPFTFLRPGK